MEQAAPVSKPKTSGMAIWSLILSFIPIVCLAGLILGIISAVKIRKRKNELKGQGLAIVAIVIGALNALASCFILPIIAAIAIPNFISYSTKAKDAQVKVVARSVQIAVEEYRVEKNDWPMSVRDIESLLPVETRQQKNPYATKETYTLDGGALVDGEPIRTGQIGYVRPNADMPYEVVFYLKAGTERLTGEYRDEEPPQEDQPQGD
jgi:type II secretory pathway pseudopilin PulG